MLDAGVFGIGILYLSLLSRCSSIGKLDRFYIPNDYRASHPYAGDAPDPPNFSRQVDLSWFDGDDECRVYFIKKEKPEPHQNKPGVSSAHHLSPAPRRQRKPLPMLQVQVSLG